MQIRFVAGLAAGLALAVAACTADVEDPGELPEVDVEAGELPAVDIDPADVDVTTDTQTVRVPEVEVNP